MSELLAIELWVGVESDGEPFAGLHRTQAQAEAAVREDLERLHRRHGDGSWDVDDAIAECAPVRIILAAGSRETLRIGLAMLMPGGGRRALRADALADAATPARLGDSEPDPGDSLLGELCRALGWQGGTRAQVLDEVRGLVALAAAHGRRP